MRNRQYKIFLKFIIISIFLSALTACKTTSIFDFIGIARIDIVNNMAKEKSLIIVDVFSSLNYPDLDIIEDDNILKINKERYQILLNHGKRQDEGYLHRYTIQLIFKEMTITKFTFKCGTRKQDWSFGRFTSTIYEPSTKEVVSDIFPSLEASKDYSLNLKVLNQSYKTFYLNDIIANSKKTSHNLSITAFPVASSQIPPHNIQVYNNIQLSFASHYFQVEGVVKLDFFTSLKKEYIYANYYINRTPNIDYLQKKGINTDELYRVSFL